jgi:hypothetical protein
MSSQGLAGEALDTAVDSEMETLEYRWRQQVAAAEHAIGVLQNKLLDVDVTAFYHDMIQLAAKDAVMPDIPESMFAAASTYAGPAGVDTMYYDSRRPARPPRTACLRGPPAGWSEDQGGGGGRRPRRGAGGLCCPAGVCSACCAPTTHQARHCAGV